MVYPEQSRGAINMINVETIVYALLGGVLPALVWLAFWLHEDYKHPEPRGLILRTFLLGMSAVILVLPFQKVVDAWFPGMTLVAILLWVILEEVFKFTAAFFGGLHSVEDNEPIDPIIYMITAALGFVALENTLFILGPLFIGEDVMRSVITGNLRFIGASLLHVLSSGIIGVFLAFSFYKSRKARVILTFLALILAIAFHTVFNLAIIYWDTSGAMLAFELVWIGVILLLLVFEKAKTIAR
ncbi:MAG: PrsW family glutamic-type intramembrane protease [bacterium]|nr:PrsW family glutamic-type intramembrane protease [bacterium]MDZ4205996.1 PrsW family glutamic-type intramembrane protease [Patescibacteria group bacterium]